MLVTDIQNRINSGENLFHYTIFDVNHISPHKNGIIYKVKFTIDDKQQLVEFVESSGKRFLKINFADGSFKHLSVIGYVCGLTADNRDAVCGITNIFAKNYNGNENSGGVYKLVNPKNKRTYIGSAKEFKSRWAEHERKLLADRHENSFLQNDFNKCNTAFEFYILEVVDDEHRLIAEQKYLDQYYDYQEQCYNIRQSVTNQGKTFSHTPEETRAKKSANSKGKPRPAHVLEALRQACIGRKISDETRAKQREAKLGKKLTPEHRLKALKTLKPRHKGFRLSNETRKKISKSKIGKVQSEETKKKISEANKKRWSDRKKMLEQAAN